MEFITKAFLFYFFIGFFLIFLYFTIYFKNRGELFFSPRPKKKFSLSIVIPCYNEEESIEKTLENVLKISYPYLKKIIVVDDCSSDNSYKIAKLFEKRDSRILVVKTPKNTGRASGAKNYGSKFVDTELIGFIDADSFPKADAISQMVGFFNDSNMGAVTSRILVKNRKNFLTFSQAIEYKTMAFNRKLFSFIDSVYVTNGPLSIYLKKAFDKVGGFDESHLTEDIEITWNLIKHGYLVQMSMNSVVYTIVPDKFKDFIKQRIRWNIGGIQVIKKYRSIFLRCGMLGLFILPYFISAWVLAFFGLGLFSYRLYRNILLRYLTLDYSIQYKTALFKFEELNFSLNILIFFGVFLLLLGILFFLITLLHNKETEFKNHKFLHILQYLFLYPFVSIYVLIISSYKYLRGNNKW